MVLCAWIPTEVANDDVVDVVVVAVVVVVATGVDATIDTFVEAEDAVDTGEGVTAVLLCEGVAKKDESPLGVDILLINNISMYNY